MAETIKIEIPVSVQDNTGSAISGIQSKLTALEKSSQKVSKMMMGSSGTRKTGIERSLEKMQRQMDQIAGATHRIELSASDDATPVINSVEDQASRLGGMSATVDVNADDNATGVMGDVDDAAAALNGSESEVELGAEDNATGVIGDVDDATAALNGDQAVVDVGADDSATGIINDVDDTLSALNGDAAVVDVSADDNAIGVINDVSDAAAALNGQEVNVVINAVDNATDTIQNAASSGYNNATGAITAAAGAAGVSLSVGSAVSNYSSFEQGMSEVKAISGATEDEFTALTQKAQEMGATTKFTATESAEAMKYMAMAGWKSEDMISGIGGIMNLAAASGEDLGSTSDIVTDALTAFGLSAKDSGHFADVLAEASADSNTNVAMLGESFKYAAPLMGSMGYSAEDTATYLGLMANAGVKGSMAGTTLRTAISNLAAPTKAMQTAMDKYGISLTDEQGNMKTLSGVMDNVRSSLSGLSEDEQAAAVKTIFGKQAMSGMLAIINASEDDYDALSESIHNCDGAADEMAATMLDNLAGSVTLFQSAFEGAQDTFGKRLEPYLRGVIDSLTAMMPDVSDAIDTIMDNVDTKASLLKDKWTAMTGSLEWKQSGTRGKINLAFDTFVTKPFQKWIGGTGKHKISEGITSLFSDALKILPGGEEAGLTSWLSAGVIGLGAVKGFGKLSEMYTSLSQISPLLGQVGVAATAAAAGIGLVAAAVDSYNQKQVDISFQKHFGDITLTDEEETQLASRILDLQWYTNITPVLKDLKEVDQLESDAETRLRDNRALDYLARCDVTLTTDEQTQYKDNVSSYADDKIKELEKVPHDATILISEFTVDSATETSLTTALSTWKTQDQIEMTGLTTELTDAVDDALSDGILNVKEEKHIAELEQKIAAITNRWRKAENTAAQSLISQKYGSLSGKDLEGGAYESLVSTMQEQRETAEASAEDAYSEYLTIAAAMSDSGRLSELGYTYEDLESQAGQALRNMYAEARNNSVSFENQTLMDTYGDTLNSNISTNKESAKSSVDYLNGEYQTMVNTNGDPTQLYSNFEDQVSNMYTAGGADHEALKSLYQNMKPDATAMGELIDEYREAGQAVPQTIMDSFNQAMQIGAASGDVDAAWQVYANQLAESGDKAMVQGILDGTVDAPEELRTALERSMADVTDKPISIDDLEAEVNGVEVTDDSVGNFEQAITNFTAGLRDTGSTAEVEVDGVHVTLGEIEVNGQSAAETLANTLGITVQELSEQTGVPEAELTAGAQVTIPASLITTDTSELQSAVQESTEGQELDAGEMDAKGTAKTDVDESETDASGAYEDAKNDTQDQFDNEMSTNGTTSVTMSQSVANAAEIWSESQADVQTQYDSQMSTNGSTSVTMAQSVANASSIWSQSKSEVQSYYNSHPMSITGTASVSISASTSTSGGGAAHSANGRYVDSPMLSLIGEAGPEFVIPVGANRRERGLDLWAQAGEALGVTAYADGGSAGVGQWRIGSSDGDIATIHDRDTVPVTDDGDIPVTMNNGGNSGGGSEGSPAITIHMSAPITVSENNDAEQVVQIIKANLRDITDEMANQLAVTLAEAYENRPVA